MLIPTVADVKVINVLHNMVNKGIAVCTMSKLDIKLVNDINKKDNKKQ